MDVFNRAILAHGGAGSNSQDSDGPCMAVKVGMDLMKGGKSALDAVISAVRSLEDDSRFNAGIGSKLRADGRTIQLDASCMMSSGDFGAVACVERIQNPIDLAHGVLLHSPHVLIVGEGAQIFALKHNIPIIYSKNSVEDMIDKSDNSLSCDTVGAVAFDGTIFAAALSSGGIKNSAIGRVGDVPLPGCGLFCGSLGSVACTGDGDYIALKIMAKKVYTFIQQGMSPNEAAEKALNIFDNSIDVGLIILTNNGFTSNARNDMAWSHLIEII